MPTDIQEAPVTHLPIADSMPKNIGHVASGPGATTEIKGRIREISWDTIVSVVESQVEQLKAKYPDLPPEEIDSMATTLFGPFRQNQEKLSAAKSEKQAEGNARIAQTLVHGLFYAGTPDADPGYVHSLYSVAATMERLAESEPGGLSTLRGYWNGIKAELAIAKTLVSGGYEISVPNYVAGVGKNEILNWDIRGGIDLIAKKGDKILLIDSKGRRQFGAGYIRTVAHINQLPMGNIPKSLHDENVDAFKEGRVKRFEIRVPVLKPFLSGLKDEGNGVSRRSALASFAVLNADTQGSIIGQLDLMSRARKAT